MDARHKTLSDVPFGTTARVRDLLHEGDVRSRLLELGLLPGVPVKRVRPAPLGCPVEIDVGGARFSLRRELLDAILVDPAA
jgi:ferrous iron transport protein A